MMILLDTNLGVVIIQFPCKGFLFINITIICPWSLNRLHIEAWSSSICIPLSRIWCSNKLWSAWGEIGTIWSTDWFSLGDWRSSMCRSPYPTSTNKGSLTMLKFDKSSPFSCTSQFWLDSNWPIGISVDLSGAFWIVLLPYQFCLDWRGTFGFALGFSFLIFLLWFKGISIYFISWHLFSRFSLLIFSMFGMNFISFGLSWTLLLATN